MAFLNWQDLSSGAIGALEHKHTVAVLPLAATEQHGPHLPTGADRFIAEGLVAEAAKHAPDNLTIVVLPTVSVGASLEHARFPGTLSLTAAALADGIVAIGGGVAHAGVKKLVLASAHGGNVAALTSAALECRSRFRLLAMTLTFGRLGYPKGIPAAEIEVGVHGGFVETSLMLHFRADLVDMARAADFASLQANLAGNFKRLRAHGPIGFGWLAGDLNPDGVVGNAAAATAEAGAAICVHQGKAFAELLTELAAADADSILAGG